MPNDFAVATNRLNSNVAMRPPEPGRRTDDLASTKIVPGSPFRTAVASAVVNFKAELRPPEPGHLPAGFLSSNAGLDLRTAVASEPMNSTVGLRPPEPGHQTGDLQ